MSLIEERAAMDKIVFRAKDKGWQLMDVADQSKTVSQLRGAVRRSLVGYKVDTNVWDNGTTVTYKVSPRG